MVKPTKPTPPDRALRSNPSTFSANAEAWITYQWSEFPDYVDSVADFTDEQADNALAPALGGDLPPLTGKALQFLRVNAGETAAEFADALVASDLVDLSQVQVEDDTSTVFGQVSGQRLAQAAAVNAPDVLNASGSAPVYACRAWVNFNGTGAVAIRASGNVSSITDNGAGDYTVNFTTAMEDANYSTVSTVAGSDPNRNSVIHSSASLGIGTKSTTTVRIVTGIASSGTKADAEDVNVCIFR